MVNRLGLRERDCDIDPAKEEFVGDDEANGLRSPPSRRVYCAAGGVSSLFLHAILSLQGLN
jgi:hypothetical protein